MSFLLHLDRPDRFSVFIDGVVRARIERHDRRWLLRSLDRAKPGGDTDLDVTDFILRHDALAPLVQRHLTATPSPER